MRKGDHRLYYLSPRCTYRKSAKNYRRSGVFMLNELRDKIKPLQETLAKPFLWAGFSPNMLSLLGFLISILAAVLFSVGEPRWAGLVILVCGFFDIIDGTVARLTGRVTQFGGILDSVLDRASDSIIFIGIIFGGLASFGGQPSWFWGVLALVGSLLVSYTRARAEVEGTGKLAVGIAERAERLMILAVGALLALTPYAVVLIVLLSFFTAGHRVLIAYQRLK